jgi:hypothetical protein
MQLFCFFLMKFLFIKTNNSTYPSLPNPFPIQTEPHQWSIEYPKLLLQGI